MKFQLDKYSTVSPEEAQKQEKPSLFQIILHNDDFTPKEFVIEMLQKLFFMDRLKASNVSLEAHIKGMAICSTGSKDYAESKVLQVVEYAKEKEFPLMCTAEVAV